MGGAPFCSAGTRLWASHPVGAPGRPEAGTPAGFALARHAIAPPHECSHHTSVLTPWTGRPQAHPRLLWLQLVEKGSNAADAARDANAPVPPEAKAQFASAARALYGWGLQSSSGVTSLERKAFLSIGKLCQ